MHVIRVVVKGKEEKRSQRRWYNDSNPVRSSDAVLRLGFCKGDYIHAIIHGNPGLTCVISDSCLSATAIIILAVTKKKT